MAIGSFVKGFSEGFARTYAIKQEEERQERLLNKQFLLEEKKKRKELEAKSKQHKSAALGLQEMYGLTEAQANTLFVRLETGMATPDKLDGLAQQFAAQNSRQQEPTINPALEALGGIDQGPSVEEQTDAIINNTELPTKQEPTVDSVGKPARTTGRSASRSTTEDPTAPVAPSLVPLTASEQLAAIYTPELTKADYINSTMEAGLDYRKEIYDAGVDWFNGLSDENKRRVFKDNQEEFLWRSALDKDSKVLLKESDRRRQIKRATSPEKGLLSRVYDQTLDLFGIGEPSLAEVPPPADFAITEKLQEQEDDLLKISGMTPEYIEKTRPDRLKDLQEQYLATPQFEDIDPQQLDDLTTLRSIEKLMENEAFKSHWLNHLTQKEYEKHIDNGDTDGVARTRTLIAMTAGPDMAAYWDGTDIGAQRLAKNLDQFEGGQVLRDEKTNMWGKPISQGEAVRQVLAQARNSGMLPPQEKYLSDVEAAKDRKKVDQEKLLKRHGVNQSLIQHKDQNNLRQAPAVADSGATASLVRKDPTQAALVVDRAELAPNTVGAQLKGMPYIKKGLARMPAMAKVIEPLDLTKFKDISAPLLTAQAAQYRRSAAVAEKRGNMDNSIMYTEYAAALEGLAASVGPKQDEFLTTPIAELSPEKVGRYLLLVQDYVDNPPAEATKGQLENAKRRVATLKKVVQYDYDNEEFDSDLFLKDPYLYVAIRQKNPARFKETDLPIVQRWAKSQVIAGIDFSKLSGADSLPMIDTYIDTIKGQLDATSKEDNPILYGKLVEQESLLRAKAKGIKDTLKPKELNLAVLGQNYFVAAAAETVAQEQMEELGAKASNETGGQIELAQHPEYRQSIQIYEEASATAQAEFENLERAVKINSLINPKEAKEYSWASNLAGIRAQQIQLTNQLGKATNEEQKRTLAEKIVMAKEIEAAYVETAQEQAAIKAQAEIDAQGGIFAIGSDGNVQKFTPQEIEAGGLQRLGADFDDKVQKATGQDSSKIQAANSARETALSVGSLSGELADIISQDSRVLTQTANFVGFLGKLKAEFEAANSVTEQRVISLAQEENLLPFNAKAGELDRLSDLNSRFNAKLIQLGFTAGASEGTSGNAMSNQDYNNLVRLISAGNTRNELTFLTNLNDYTQRRIAQADSMVNTTRSPGSSLFNTVDIAVTSDQARDALLKRLSPPDVATYVKDNPTEFRVQNYQKLQQVLDNARKRQEGGTNLRQIMFLLQGSGLEGVDTNRGLIQKSQEIDSQLKELVNTINSNPAFKNNAIDAFKGYAGQTYGLQLPDLDALVDLYINQPQQR
jgi:hypothetical protein